MSSDHPIGAMDVEAWLRIHGIDEQCEREKAWKVIRAIDSWQMARWADDREHRTKGNRGSG